MRKGPNLRVMSVITSLVPGGAERSLADLLPKLRDRGIEVEICCIYRHQPGLDTDLRKQGFRISFLHSSTALGRIVELRRLLKARRPDLLHTTIIEADILGRMSAFGVPIPVVSSLVNTSYDQIRLQDSNLRPWKLRIVRSLDRFSAKHMAVAFHALTEAVADHAVETLGVRRAAVTVIGRWRDLMQLGEVTPHRRTEARENLGLESHHEVVLSVGRQDYQKGQVTLVEVARRLSVSRPNLRILIAGRIGSAATQIMGRIKESGLGKVVLVLGHRGDVPDLLASADIFAFPSLFEGFGGSLLEAMAMGIPALASDLPALREVAGPCARYAAIGQVEEWANAIATLLDRPQERAELALCARTRVRQLFDGDEIADRYAEWYRLWASPPLG